MARGAAIALLLALVVPASGPRAAGLPSVTIGTTRDPNNGAQVIVAQALGFFKESGVDATVKYFSSGAELANAMAAQAVSIGAGGSVPTTLLRGAGLQIVVLAQESNISGVTKLVAQKDIASPEQLSGKKVGLVFGSQGEMLLDAFTKRLNISKQSITPVNLAPADMVTALVRGDVAAGIIWEPWASEAVRGGMHQLLSGTTLYTGSKPQTMNFIGDHSILFGLKDWVSKNPEATQAMLRALVKAQRVLQNEPDRAAEAIGKELGLPQSQVKPLLGNNVYSLAVTPKLVDDLNGVATFLLQHGKLKGAVKAEDWVDSMPLRSVDASLVSWPSK